MLKSLVIIMLLLPSIGYGNTYSNTVTPVKIVGFSTITGLNQSNTILPILLPPGTQAYVSVPQCANSPCTAGAYAADANYFYICEATNTWLRVATATWTCANAFLLLADGTDFILLQGGGKIILQ